MSNSNLSSPTHRQTARSTLQVAHRRSVGEHLLRALHNGRENTSYDHVNSSNRMEVDFLVVRPFPNAAMKPRMSPVEVKSPRQYGTSSLDKLKAKCGKRVDIEYMLHPNQMKVDGERVRLPPCMAMYL